MSVSADLNAKLDLARIQLAQLDAQRAQYSLAAHNGADIAFVQQGASFAFARARGANANESAALDSVNAKRVELLSAIEELELAVDAVTDAEKSAGQKR